MTDPFDAWLDGGLRELDGAVPVGEALTVASSRLAPVRVVRSERRSIVPIGAIAAAAVIIVAVAVLVWRSPATGPGAVTPSSIGTPVAATPSTVASPPSTPGDVTHVIGGLSFVAPANWGIVVPHQWIAPVGPHLFLSNAPIADPCPTAWLGIQCWLPLTELPADGILVSFEGSAVLSLPNPTPVPIEGPAVGQCAQIGGERQYGVLLQGFGVDACLGGPDFDANATAFVRLVNSIRRVDLEPSPSPVPSSSASRSASLDVKGAGLFGTVGLWVLENGQVLTSTDRGAHWHTVGPWGLSSDLLDADHAWTLTAGPGSTEQNGSSTDVLHLVVSRTSDGGSIWKSSSVPGTYANTFPQVRFLNPTTGYLLAAAARQSDGIGTLLRTSDGGSTWHVMTTLKWAGSTFGLSTTGTLWIGANAEAGPVAHPLLISSRDGGRTWNDAILPGFEGRTGGADLYVPEPPVFWNADDGVVEVADSAGPVHLYRTTDGGRTWTLATERPTGGEGGATGGGAFIDPTHWLLAEIGSDGQVIGRTTDGGASWTTTTPMGLDPSAAGILSLRFWNPTDGTAVVLEDTGSPLLVTSDGGVSWTPAAAP